MKRFEEAYLRTIGYEGYYANEPWDDGGETYRGISRVHNPDWEGWVIVDAYKAEYGEPLPRNHRIHNAQLDELVKERYYHNYWQPIRGDEIPHKALSELLYDFYVQSGAHAVKALQAIVNDLRPRPRLQEDGVLGPKTLRGVLDCDNARLHDHLKARRKAFLRNWAKNKQKSERILSAVLNRVNKFPNQLRA